MLDWEQKALLDKAYKRGYVIYLIFFVILWFSKKAWIDITTISIAVIFVLCHQGYYFYRKQKLVEIKIGF